MFFVSCCFCYSLFNTASLFLTNCHVFVFRQDVRMKNWKLIEALQNAEATARTTTTAKTKTNTAQSLGVSACNNKLLYPFFIYTNLQ